MSRGSNIFAKLVKLKIVSNVISKKHVSKSENIRITILDGWSKQAKVTIINGEGKILKGFYKG